ncbi:Protein NDX-8 [Aphelenchoides avenae]|nr:Protein NDX-8 [Aphelenchus avenae]
MKEVDDRTTTETALREAYEEIGLPSNYVQLVGPLMPFVSRHMIMLYPVLSVLCRPFVDYSLDAEVQKVFWTPLSNFLDDEHHNSFYFDKTFQLHNFLLEEPVFGLTAFICVVLAIGIYNRLPRFQMDIISDRSVPPRRKMLDFVRNGSKLLPEISRDALSHAIKARL